MRGDVDEIPLGGVAVLPPDCFRRRTGKTFQLAERLGQHGRVVVAVDDPIAPAVFFQEGWGKVIVAEPAATFPVDGLADAPLVFAVDDLFQAGDDVGMTMLPQLDIG